MKLTIGRIVNFVLADRKTIRPAIVVEAWSDECANLRVFLDGSNDTRRLSITSAEGHSYNVCTPDEGWATSSPLAEPVDGELLRAGSWHWPARV